MCISVFIAEVCYVPVYRSVDNSVPPVLGTPCGLEYCYSPPQPCSGSGLPRSPVNPLLVGRAFAGPMSPAKVCVCLSVFVCVCVLHVCMYVVHTFRQKTFERDGGHLAELWI